MVVLYIPGEINGQKCDISDIQRSIRNMQNDMLKLNQLLHKERGTEHVLEQNTKLMEGDFVGSLKACILQNVCIFQVIQPAMSFAD